LRDGIGLSRLTILQAVAAGIDYHMAKPVNMAKLAVLAVARSAWLNFAL
jgi:hypothetical protein